MCSPVLLTPLYKEKLRREDIKWEASDKGGAQWEDRKRAEAMGATQNLYKGKWDKTTFRKKGLKD